MGPDDKKQRDDNEEIDPSELEEPEVHEQSTLLGGRSADVPDDDEKEE